VKKVSSSARVLWAQPSTNSPPISQALRTTVTRSARQLMRAVVAQPAARPGPDVPLLVAAPATGLVGNDDGIGSSPAVPLLGTEFTVAEPVGFPTPAAIHRSVDGQPIGGSLT
jgi:hypothetical protein